MADRKRRRTILGYTEIPCPHCGSGPLVLTSSQYERRLRDVVNPRFDAKLAYRETCQVCRMRFGISPEARRFPVRSQAMATAPTPLFTGADTDTADDDEPVRPATPIRSKKPTQAAFFTDDDELDD